MSMIKNTLPAERQLSCLLAENFDNVTAVIENGGQTYGSPTIDRGVVLNGTTDYVQYNDMLDVATRHFSAVIEFIPNFLPTDDTLYYWFSSTTGYTVFKHNNAGGNVIRIVIGGFIIADIAYATYSPYWITGGLNRMVISSKGGSTDAWLNGGKILSSAAIGWASGDFGTLRIGADNVFPTPTYYFNGTIKSVKFFKYKIGSSTSRSYSLGTPLDYMNTAVLDLSMLMESHDPVNSRTLDKSGNNNHGAFGSGTAEPTKNTYKPGYYFDGSNDIISIPSVPTNTFGDGLVDRPFSISIWVKMNSASNFFAVMKRNGNNEKEFQLGVAASKMLYFVLFDYSTGGIIGRTSGYNLANHEGQWAHIVGTYDGLASDSGMQFYINAIKRDTSPNSSGSYVAMENTGTPIILGQLLTGFARGDMAYLKIFDSEISPLQIYDLYIKESKKLNRI